MSSDPDIIHLLEGYQSEHPVTVIGYRNNMRPAQGKLEAVCFTRRMQCLVSSEGGNIEAGSGRSVSKRQQSKFSLAIPKNALSRPVALTLNYTPNAPVLQMPAIQQMKAVKYDSSKSEQKTMLSQAVLPHKSNTQLIAQFEKSEIQLASPTPPVIDFSETAKDSVISPFVTITATQPVSLSEEAHLNIPHCAESTSKSKKVKAQFRIKVKLQSLGPDNSLSEWTTLQESKVNWTDEEVNVRVSKFQRASTFVAVASSTSEKPIKKVMKKKLSFSIVGNPILERRMYVAAVYCTNAYNPGKLVAKLKEDLSSPAPLQPWYPSHEQVSAEGDIKVVMSALEGGWSFHPSNREIKQADLSSPDAIQLCCFCLCCNENKLQRACCQCSLQYDATETKVAFLTPKPVGVKDESPAEPNSSSKRFKAEEAEQKANSSNVIESFSGIPTTQQLTKLAKCLVADDMWKYIARHLGFEETTLDEISEKYKGNPREQAYRMLLKWKEAQSCAASIWNLSKALMEEDLTTTAADVFGIRDESLKSL